MSDTEAPINDSIGRTFYTRVAIGGLIAIAAAMVVLAIVQIASGDTSNLVFFVINVAIALVVASLIWRFGQWALVLGAIAGLLGLVLAYGPYLVEAAGNINSVLDFGVAVVANVASLVALVGSIVAFVQVESQEVV